ncbi:putative ATP-dependent RNA helicase DDX60 [Acropora cervicornis]|uniref:ATP-dependent RNA helicase DDX60 n=1 Tax=Acropora cervicornis TaxID=6130 RepID=A0AAD9R3G4_ACRCE|nr:putative ATP-dependent RNA helicase DDX60 [Acropora cervicornis]
MEYIYPSVEEDNLKFNCKRQKGTVIFRFQIIRQDVYTDMNVVPILPLKKANSVGHVLLLNAYALDFFKHGSQKVIERENGIKAGEVFFLLKDFYLTIKSISCSLEEIGPEDDNVVLAFKQLAREFGEKFNNQF